MQQTKPERAPVMELESEQVMGFLLAPVIERAKARRSDRGGREGVVSVPETVSESVRATGSLIAATQQEKAPTMPRAV